MDLKLTGKVALVTGASRGIGRAIARGLANEGCDVAACAVRSKPLGEAAAALARESGRTVEGFAADLTKADEAERMVAAVFERFGRVDILVNNAGAAPGGVLETLSEDDWALALQLKFMGYVRVMKHVLPRMVAQGGGRVVNLIGNDGVKHSYWEIAPGAANAAGQNLTMSLAGQYARHNVTFVAVNPGPVRTERWDGLVRAMARDMKISVDAADRLAPRSIPVGRIAEPEEVADLVTFLASDRAHYVNGTMIEIDGGQQKPIMDVARDG
jgi:3-oxoacyl-[acyl-carrier protein] reductase